VDTTKVPQLNAANTFTGNQTITGNLTASGSVTASTMDASNGFYVGGTLFDYGSAPLYDAFLAFAGNGTMTGAQNLAAGYFSLWHNVSGGQNTAFGIDTLEQNQTGNYNLAVGGDALLNNQSGSFNSAGGEGALVTNLTGNYNTAFGANALNNTDQGSNNTGIGVKAGAISTLPYTTGSNNTFVGAFTTPGTQTTLSNATAVGAQAEVDASNSMVLGSINGINSATASTKVGIGITSPTFLLHIGNAGGSSYNNFLRVEGPTQPGTGGYAGSFGGYGAFNIDKPFVSGGRFTVTEAGLVGINTNTPDNALSVNGSADKPSGGSWGTYSDRRLKNLGGTFGSGLSQVLKINPIRYRYKEDNGMGISDHEEHIGVVAQEIQKLIPEAVTQNSKGYLLVNNDPIIWAMLNAIKEQQQQIRLERKRMKAQQSEIAVLRQQVHQQGARNAALESRLIRLERNQAADATKIAVNQKSLSLGGSHNDQ
jgi:hypothetical protein